MRLIPAILALFFWSIPIRGAAQTETSVTHFVSKECSDLGLPSARCHVTIQDCVDDLEASHPDDGRNCIIYPGHYVEAVSATLTTGATNLIGFGVGHDSAIPVPVRMRAPSDSTGGTVTLEIASGTAKNVAIYGGEDAGDVAFRVPSTSGPFVQLQDSMIYMEFLKGSSRVAEILGGASNVVLDSVDMESFVCVSSATSAAAGIFIDATYRTTIRNSSLVGLGSATQCADVAVIEVAGGELVVDHSLVTAGGRLSAFEIDDENVILRLAGVSLEGAANGRLVRVNGSNSGSFVGFSGVDFVPGKSFGQPSVWGAIVPVGELHFDVTATPTFACFPGWTATNGAGGTGSTFYGCEGSSPAWVAK